MKCVQSAFIMFVNNWKSRVFIHSNAAIRDTSFGTFKVSNVIIMIYLYKNLKKRICFVLFSHKIILYRN